MVKELDADSGRVDISHAEAAVAEKLPAVNVMPMPLAAGECVAGLPFIPTVRTLPLPSEQADLSFAENPENEDCESDRSRRDCAAEARRDEAAYAMPKAERKIMKTSRVSIEACAREKRVAASCAFADIGIAVVGLAVKVACAEIASGAFGCALV